MISTCKGLSKFLLNEGMQICFGVCTDLISLKCSSNYKLFSYARKGISRSLIRLSYQRTVELQGCDGV